MIFDRNSYQKPNNKKIKLKQNKFYRMSSSPFPFPNTTPLCFTNRFLKIVSNYKSQKSTKKHAKIPDINQIICLSYYPRLTCRTLLLRFFQKLPNSCLEFHRPMTRRFWMALNAHTNGLDSFASSRATKILPESV